MKNTLKKLFLGLTFGIGLSAGVLLVMFGKEYIEERDREWYTYHNDGLPEYIKIISHEQDISKPKFTIRGKLKNTSNVKYTQIGLYAAFFADGALINVCEETYPYEVSPAVEIDFEIACDDMQAGNLPKNIEFKVGVKFSSYVTKKEEN